MSKTPEKKEAKPKKSLEGLRLKQIAETEAMAKKQRFALFSYPPPLCIGETSQNSKFFPARDQNGKIATMSRNIQISHSKSGKVKASYFSNLSFVTVGDRYFDPNRLDRMKFLEENKKIPKDKGIFKPASFYKSLVKPSYKHESDYNEEKISRIDADGKVILHPKNIVTGPSYKPLYKSFGHIPDEYERTRTLNREERIKHIAKLGDHPAFRNMECGNRPFVKDSKAYGLDRPLQEASKKKELHLNIAEHDQPFKPSNPAKKGHNKTIAPFPKYQGNPIKALTRIDLKKTKDPYRTRICGDLTCPTPSITSHPINIRKEILSTTHLK